MFAGFAAPASAVQVADDLGEVNGRLIVVDRAGVEQSKSNGIAYVSLLFDSKTLGIPSEECQPRRFPVIDGHFSFKIRKGRRVRFDLLELDGGQARPIPNPTKNLDSPRDDGVTFRDPFDAELVVRARYLPLVRVHLLDAEDHSELSGVDVIREPRTPPDEVLGDVFPLANSISLHPLPFHDSDVRMRATASPLDFPIETDSTIPFLRWRERFWCHAPGHCWTRLDVDHLVGGESTVQVARSGSMKVSVSGPLPLGSRLVLKPPENSDQSLFEWWPVSPEEESRFDGLPAGNYRLELQAGSGAGPRILLGSTGVSIEQRKESSVAIAASPVPKASLPWTMPVAIELRLDAGWNDEPFEILLDPFADSPSSSPPSVRIPRSSLLPRKDEPDRWSTDGLALAPGTWWLRIERFRILRKFEVDAKSRILELDVGPPVDVAFHLLDARSHAPVLVRKPSWHVPARDTSGERLLIDWPRSPRNHTLRARVPAGPIELVGESDEIDWSDPVVVDVAAADHDVDVPLKRAIGIRVRFTLDDETLEWGRVFPGKPPEGFSLPYVLTATLPFPDGSALRLVPTGAAASEPNLAKLDGWNSENIVFLAPSPGTFAVSFRAPKDFEPIPPREISIPDERVVDVVIALTRKE